jgi:hypothetical protein
MLSLRPQLRLRGRKPPQIRALRNSLKGIWEFLVDRRALAYVLFRCERSSGPTREKLARLATVLERRLLKRPPGPLLPHNPTAAAADLEATHVG